MYVCDERSQLGVQVILVTRIPVYCVSGCTWEQYAHLDSFRSFKNSRSFALRYLNSTSSVFLLGRSSFKF